LHVVGFFVTKGAQQMVNHPFDPSAVLAILLADGVWHPVRDFQLVSLTGTNGPAWKTAFYAEATETMSQERYLTGPLSSLLAVRTRYVETAEDRAERLTQMAADAEEFFQYQHFCGSDLYETTVAEQDGFCAGCGALLEIQPITHYVADRDAVLCQACSPLTPRYGRP
jgi:hypothetical protein